eukprot:CAMPEP_0181175728 /NCGR_PEP_ID=MMETSP1096-20121128/4238_1 /TAXON_ID=156174 ORGANISM="Chrysochromulina ericina, Strain CCMP281" /NCGR_SAMPLE_ID=MMETSP1096 /ASSEMBLY_ACC=CAM_ASM_000453 /LENGTH=98 /DNA_ID=CAMNT_0023263743 /DNA_START=345 /DNA_END=638 /DNA_ORIENTATION=+
MYAQLVRAPSLGVQAEQRQVAAAQLERASARPDDPPRLRRLLVYVVVDLSLVPFDVAAHDRLVSLRDPPLRKGPLQREKGGLALRTEHQARCGLIESM